MADVHIENQKSYNNHSENMRRLLELQKKPRVNEPLFGRIIFFSIVHASAVYGGYLFCTSAMWSTVLFTILLHVLQNFGVMAGAHRLWSHRSFKATLPLEILLMLLNSLAFQYTAKDWVRNHRMHHKYSDTDADPYNANRGFFFSHVGWNLVRKHPEIKRLGNTIDMSDIYNNPVLQFQEQYATPLIFLICFLLPTVIPVYFWGESLNNAWHVAVMFRWMLGLNIAFSLNSVAHKWGYKPYDRTILPTNNYIVAMLTLGEGLHNYHHVFPWDYRTSELGSLLGMDFTKAAIDVFAWMGWAYDLRTVSTAVTEMRSQRTGDSTKRM